jgi:hypothetical protein
MDSAMPSFIMSFARAGSVAGLVIFTCQPARAFDPSPHLARYQVYLGAAPGSPAIGSGLQRLSHDCRQWTHESEVHVDFNLAGNLQMHIDSRLKGTESFRGDSFTYELTRMRNDIKQQISGTVTMLDKGGRAAVRYPSGPVGLDLPARTAMPVKAIGQALARLKKGGGNFSITTFDPETVGNAMTVDVAPAPRESVRQRLAATMARSSDAAEGWPINMSFSSATRAGTPPYYTLNGMMLESGALDRLTIRSGFFTFAADLIELQPIDTPQCPRA